MYYNPTLNDIKSHEELMRKYNTSFSQSIKKFKDYYKIYKEDIPITTIYQTVKENPIQLIDDRYVITYYVTYKSLEELKAIKFKEIESSFNCCRAYDSCRGNIASGIGSKLICGGKGFKCHCT